MDKHTILIVDDEKMILEITAEALADDQYIILTAQNGMEGLSILKTNHVHLIICDQKMPGQSGLEFLKKVRQGYPDILTIMQTGYGDIDTAVKAINDVGIYKFILKPCNMADLKITVRRALEMRQMVFERDSLLVKVNKQDLALKEIEKQYPGITNVKRDSDGDVVIGF